MKKQYTFVLNFGYAESQTLYYTPFTSREKFANAKEALIDLANYFRKHYEGTDPPKKCCTAAKAKDAEAAFCAKCGLSLKDEEFDADGYIEFVKDIGGADSDTCSANYIEWTDDAEWAYTSPDGPNPRYVFTAEKVLAAAIGHSPDDRITIDSIFKDRTSSKGNSFSFW